MKVPVQFRSIVGGATKAAGAIGVPGAFSFGADVPILLSIWATGAGMICSRAGHAPDSARLKALATTAVGGAASFIGGSKLAGKLFHAIPGPGTLAAIGINSALDAYFTYRFLKSVSVVHDKYDSGTMAWQNLKSSAILFGYEWGDISDMFDCMDNSSLTGAIFK